MPERSSSASHASEATPNAIKIEDAAILRPDFYRTTKAGGERQRLALACQICRHKKVRCNGALPKCARCANLELDCEYKLTTHRRSKHQVMPDKRGKKRKDSAGDTSAGLGAVTLRTELDAPSLPEAISAASAQRKRQRTESFTDPLSSSAAPISHHARLSARLTTGQDKTGDRAVMHDMGSRPSRNLQAQDWPGGHLLDPSRRYDLPEPLPSHKLLMELCQIYFSRIYGQMYAFLHPPSFMRAVVEAPTSINPALLLAIAAVSSRFHTTASSDDLKPDLWASASANIVFGVPDAPSDPQRQQEDVERWSRVNLSTPSVSCVQALSMLSYHYFGQGRSSLAWILSGFAVRMAHALHLNAEFYDDPIGFPENNPPGIVVSFKDREVRRRTFWALYIMDRLNSAGEQRPFTIQNHEVNIQLPVEQTLFDREVPALTSSINSPPPQIQAPQSSAASMDCMAWLIRIVDIWGQVTCFVQQPAGPVRWDSKSPLMSLRKKASLWLDSLPPSMQYENAVQTQKTAGWYIMHTAYHLSLCIMHRFALPKPSTAQQYSISHIPANYLNMCVKEAIYNASRVSEIIQSRPTSIRLTAPFMGFAAFSAATMHAFLGFHVPEMDPETKKCYRAYVYTSLEFLRDLGVAWTPLSKMHDALASQIHNRPRSVRSNRSSILHESPGIGSEQFRVPDSMPTQFSVDQQIQMNTLAFSNWFNDPMTQIFFEPSGTNPTRPGWSADSSPFPTPVMFDTPMVEHTAQPLLQSIQSHTAGISGLFTETPSEANSSRSDDDTLAADLLVSFKQSEYLGRGARPPIPQGDSPHHEFYGRDVQTTSREGFASERRNAARRAEYTDRLGNIKDTGAGGNVSSVDVLQLMKVGLITAQHWL